MGQPHTAIERIARYLARRPERAENWQDHIEDAANLLALIQQPDEAMTEAGDATIWIAMIDAALRDRWTIPGALDAPAQTVAQGFDEEGETPIAPETLVEGDTASWVGINEREKSA